MILRVLAPAKINLTLEILGRRPDGYHRLRSVMQAISLHDVIVLEDTSHSGIAIAGGSPDAPADACNLVYRAACALNEATDGGHGALIRLEKRVPVGAGLGGGSSDAAATLQALNGLWKTGLTTDQLMGLGATLGSDVPFFFTGGTALAEGRGEVLTPVSSPRAIWLVIVWPGVKLATPSVYQRFAADHVAETTGRNASDAMIRALSDGSLEHISAALEDDLQPSAFRLCPVARAVQSALREAGLSGAMLSGSGSAVFGLARDEDQARGVSAAMRGRGWWSEACHTTALPYEGDK